MVVGRPKLDSVRTRPGPKCTNSYLPSGPDDTIIKTAPKKSGSGQVTSFAQPRFIPTCIREWNQVELDLDLGLEGSTTVDRSLNDMVNRVRNGSFFRKLISEPGPLDEVSPTTATWKFLEFNVLFIHFDNRPWGWDFRRLDWWALCGPFWISSLTSPFCLLLSSEKSKHVQHMTLKISKVVCILILLSQ